MTHITCDVSHKSTACNKKSPWVYQNIDATDVAFLSGNPTDALDLPRITP